MYLGVSTNYLLMFLNS